MLSLSDELTYIESNEIEKQLYNKKYVNFHTEIHNPQATATFLVVADFLADLKIKKELTKYLKNYKIDMIAFKRQRAKETIDAVRAKKEQENKTLEDIMLGKGGE